MTTTRICHICGTEVEKHTICPVCVEAVPCYKSPELMSVDERIAELRVWFDGVLEIPAEMVFNRINSLVGRAIFTHEYASKTIFDRLCEEIRGIKAHPTVEHIFLELEEKMPDRVMITKDTSNN